ncbi:MAG: NAD-dependent epimerase/dehydratase family protein [Syntrophobacteraceae bacterium]
MGIGRSVITGATGPLGIALAKYLAGRGIDVIALVHPGSKRIAYVPASDRVTIEECDLSQLGSLESRLPRDCDVFFHLGWDATASRTERDDPFLHALNIRYTLDAVKLAHALGCKTFIGAGSQSELHRGGNFSDQDDLRLEESYGIAKYAASRLSLRLCGQYGMHHCWARILSIFGPGERETTALMYCIHTLLQGQKPSLTRGEQLWDYLYAADCARAFYLIARNGRHGATYSVGSGCSRPLKEYFERTRDRIDPALPLGLGEKEYPRGQVMELTADIGELTLDTGFIPEYSFEQGICETIDWVKNRMVKTDAAMEN